MRSRDFETPVTVSLSANDLEPVICSAVLERDPYHLKWNRICLIGSDNDLHAVRRLSSAHNLQWEFVVNSQWSMGSQFPQDYRTSGRGVIRSSGMMSGINILPGSVQKFAEVEVHEIKEAFPTGDESETSASFWFLQRPTGWYPSRQKHLRREEFSRYGDWRRLPTLGLSFRFCQMGHARSDQRVSRETELLEIPAVEIRPLSDCALDDFETQAALVWFGLRILIIFRYRQIVSPLAEFRQGDGRYTQVWYPQAIREKAEPPDFHEPVFLGAPEAIFAKALPALSKHRAQHELLHAAAFGYAASYQSLSLENGLTMAVEGLERLVCAFEGVKGLTREIVDRRTWNPVAQKIKQVVTASDLPPDVQSRVKRSLASPNTLSLQERIERMIYAYQSRWSSHDLHLAAELSLMLKARNNIVHGRLTGDINVLYVELVRARALFERLFLNFVGCHDAKLSGHANLVVGYAPVQTDS